MTNNPAFLLGYKRNCAIASPLQCLHEIRLGRLTESGGNDLVDRLPVGQSFIPDVNH
jgi:hypothetical protein